MMAFRSRFRYYTDVGILISDTPIFENDAYDVGFVNGMGIKVNFISLGAVVVTLVGVEYCSNDYVRCHCIPHCAPIRGYEHRAMV